MSAAADDVVETSGSGRPVVCPWLGAPQWSSTQEVPAYSDKTTARIVATGTAVVGGVPLLRLDEPDSLVGLAADETVVVSRAVLELILVLSGIGSAVMISPVLRRQAARGARRWRGSGARTGLASRTGPLERRVPYSWALMTARKRSAYFSSFAAPMPGTRLSCQASVGRSCAIERSVESCRTT